MLRASDLRQKTKQDLENLVLDLRREQFNLRMQKGSGQAVKTHRFREVRQEIARIKTILREQQVEVRR